MTFQRFLYEYSTIILVAFSLILLILQIVLLVAALKKKQDAFWVICLASIIASGFAVYYLPAKILPMGISEAAIKGLSILIYGAVFYLTLLIRVHMDEIPSRIPWRVICLLTIIISGSLFLYYWFARLLNIAA